MINGGRPAWWRPPVSPSLPRALALGLSFCFSSHCVDRYSRELGAGRETGLTIWTFPPSCPQTSMRPSAHQVTFPVLHACMHRLTNTHKYSGPTTNPTTQRGPMIPQHEDRSWERRVGAQKGGTETGMKRYTQRWRCTGRQTSSESRRGPKHPPPHTHTLSSVTGQNRGSA